MEWKVVVAFVLIIGEEGGGGALELQHTTS